MGRPWVVLTPACWLGQLVDLPRVPEEIPTDGPPDFLTLMHGKGIASRFRGRVTDGPVNGRRPACARHPVGRDPIAHVAQLGIAGRTEHVRRGHGEQLGDARGQALGSLVRGLCRCLLGLAGGGRGHVASFGVPPGRSAARGSGEGSRATPRVRVRRTGAVTPRQHCGQHQT
jgi:hypothetical protein